ncbi:DUF423 domain-containing protein [Parasediminibacterium paludis]|uniref:DUF423 domain-containing protein n=1 Tax=Parasediminibacterium paludis TaxID=908966 RepID=A0ABV8Q0T0_9BACT
MHKGYIKTAAFLGALSVMLGAFAAHKLKQMLTEQSLNIFETGVRYQVYHVFALALTALIYKEFSNKLITTAGILFMLGIGFFSGSLYLLTYLSAKGIVGYEWVGAITPIGGLFFIIGWLCLSLGVKYK